MSDDEDDSSKTEEPSQKKLDDARKKGQLVSSREVGHFFMMLGLAFFIMVLAPGTGQKTINLLAPFITQPDEMEMSGAGFAYIMRQIAYGLIMILAMPLFVTFVCALAPSVVQNKWVVSAENMKPKLEKLSLLKGFKKMFGMKSIIEFLKNLVKISIISFAAVMVVMPYRDYLFGLPTLTKAGMLLFTQTLAAKMMIAACIVLFLMSLGDYVYQRFMFMKQMRMTKQEVKEEYKQQEGDPHIKGKLKAIRREKAKARMMANLHKADVIITNPTHYAVALQYDANSMAAPKLIAKGVDDVAGRIREAAAKNRTPIVRNPPLARVLYDTTDIDDDVPVEHYAAVAKVIGYVYKLKGKVPQKPVGKPAQGKPGQKKPITINMPQAKKK